MSGVILEGNKPPQYVTREQIEEFGVEVAQNIAELYRRTEVLSDRFAQLVQAMAEAGMIEVESSEPEAEQEPES